jgi:hypothetical protein
MQIKYNDQSEQSIQKAVMEWAGIMKGKYPQLCMLYHVPNGGTRDVVEATNLKRQGVKKGVPDLVLASPNTRYAGLYIELKKAKSGTLSQEQKIWIRNLNAIGYFAACCRGFKEAVECLEWYLSIEALPIVHVEGVEWRELRNQRA